MATIVAPLLTLKTYIQEVAVATQVSQGTAAGKVLGSSSEIVGMSKAAAIVGLVISVGIPWGIFMYQALSGDVKVGTIAFNTALAYAIATTIVAIVMFALSLTVVGFIFTAVLGFVDLLLLGLCEAGVSGACFSLVGSVTGALAKPDLQQRHRPSTSTTTTPTARATWCAGRLRDAAVQPRQWLRGRQLESASTRPVKTTLYHNVPGGGAIGYVRQLFQGQQPALLHVRYWLEGDDFSAPAAARDAMTSRLARRLCVRQQEYRIWYVPWPDATGSGSIPATPTRTITSPWLTLAKGLNQQIPLNLYMRYAVPGYECWTASCRDQHADAATARPPGRQPLLRRLPDDAG